MKIIAALALLLIGSLVIAAEPNRAYTGTVIEVSSDRLTIDQTGSGTVVIGFATDVDAVNSLRKIRAEDEVRAVFGSTQGPRGGSINKLLSIRVCTKNDKECLADYKRQEIKAQEDAKKRDISDKKHELCRATMQATLSSDARYIAKNSVPVSNTHLARYNALAGTARTCASKLLEEHEASVLEACLMHHCGDNIGGGCRHIAGYSTNSSAIQNAVNQCSN